MNNDDYVKIWEKAAKEFVGNSFFTQLDFKGQLGYMYEMGRYSKTLKCKIRQLKYMIKNKIYERREIKNNPWWVWRNEK